MKISKHMLASGYLDLGLFLKIYQYYARIFLKLDAQFTQESLATAGAFISIIWLLFDHSVQGVHISGKVLMNIPIINENKTAMCIDSHSKNTEDRWSDLGGTRSVSWHGCHTKERKLKTHGFHFHPLWHFAKINWIKNSVFDEIVNGIKSAPVGHARNRGQTPIQTPIAMWRMLLAII